MADSSQATDGPAVSNVTGRQLFGVLATGGAGLAALFFIYLFWARTRVAELVDPARMDILAGALAYTVFLAASWLVAVRRSEEGWDRIGLRRCDPSLFWIGGFLALIWVGVSSAIYAAAGIWETTLAAGADMIAPFRDDATALIGLFVLAGPVAALVEEILFRGMIYGWLRRRLNIAGAAILSALIFTATHYYVFVAGVAAAIDMTVLAVLLALLFELSRSLWPGILCHALNNVLLLALYLYRG